MYSLHSTAIYITVNTQTSSFTRQCRDSIRAKYKTRILLYGSKFIQDTMPNFIRMPSFIDTVHIFAYFSLGRSIGILTSFTR